MCDTTEYSRHAVGCPDTQVMVSKSPENTPSKDNKRPHLNQNDKIKAFFTHTSPAPIDITPTIDLNHNQL